MIDIKKIISNNRDYKRHMPINCEKKLELLTLGPPHLIFNPVQISVMIYDESPDNTHSLIFSVIFTILTSFVYRRISRLHKIA